jgi:hypothetical protein
MDPLFIAGIIVLTMVSALVLPRLGATARRRRKIRRTPLSPLAEVRSGEVVRVRGVVRAVGAPLPLPFGDGDAVLHVTQIVDSSNPGSTISWTRTGRRALLVEDETGRARIAVETPIEVIADEASGGVGRDDPTVVDLLGSECDRIYSKGAVILWRQRSISVGDEVTAWGRATLEPDDAGPGERGHYRTEASRVLLLPATREGSVVVEIRRRATTAA